MMAHIICRTIVITTFILILFSTGCVKKRMIITGPGCPNKPGVTYIKFGIEEWKDAQNLPWIRINTSSINPESIVGSGVAERDLLHAGTLSIPNGTSIEIASYYNPSEPGWSKGLIKFLQEIESYGLKIGKSKFLGNEAWFRDNQCFATVEDKSTKEYIWFKIDPIPCASKYQLLYAPGIGGADFLVLKR